MPKSRLRSLKNFHSGAVSKRSEDDPLPAKTYFRKGVALIAGLAVLAGLGYGIMQAWITEVKVEITSVDAVHVSLDKSRVEAAIQTYFDQNSFSKHRWLLNTNALEDSVKEQIIDIDTVETDAHLIGKTLSVSVSGREKALQWRSADNTYEIDVNGVAYANVGDSPEKGVLVVDDNNIPVVLGQAVAPAPTIALIKSLVAGSSAFDRITISAFSIPDELRELQIELANKDYVVIARTDQSSAEILVSLDGALKHISKNKLKVSEHIDLRVSGKAIYK